VRECWFEVVLEKARFDNGKVLPPIALKVERRLMTGETIMGKGGTLGFLSLPFHLASDLFLNPLSDNLRV